MSGIRIETTVAMPDDTEGTFQLVVSKEAEAAVLFDFNPTASSQVAEIKALHAGLITIMQEIRDTSVEPARRRVASIAITQLEIAQMLCVKALFAR